MQARRMKLPLVMVLSLVVLIVFFIAIATYLVLPSQTGDPGFDARVSDPVHVQRHPRVMFDEGHYNVHTSNGRYKPFADLIRNDGYEVMPNTDAFSAAVLQGNDVLVVANALGFRGAAQQLANLFRLEGKVRLAGSAFTPDEIAAVRAWVGEGGSLLLISDHAPAGSAAAAMAAVFGVEMTNWYVEDPAQHDPETRNPSFILYSKANGLLGDHPITEGLSNVLTFTGQSLKAPPGASAFLRMSPAAIEYPRRKSSPEEARSAANLAQGVALEFGKGRAVILGEAGMLTSQVTRIDRRVLRFGMGYPGYDNRQLARNIMRWLSESPSGRHPRSTPVQ